MPSFTSQMRLPEFHGDPQQYPNETWDTYEADLELAYAGSGVSKVDEVMRKAHLLTGLRGPAARYLRLNPGLRTMPYWEALKTLRKYFRRFHAPGIEDLSRCKQKPGESVLEYVARLKDTLSTLGPEEEYVALTKKEAKDLLKSEEGVDLVEDEDIKESQRTYRKINEEMTKRLFLKGVRDEFKTALRNRMPKTLQDAIEIAEEIERYSSLYEGASFNATLGRASDMSRSASPHPGSKREQDHVVKEASEQLRALNTSDRDPRRNRSSERTRNSPQGVPPRYSRSSDRNDQFQEDDYSRRFRCYYCGRQGHVVRDCQLKIADELPRRAEIFRPCPTCQPVCVPLGNSMDHGPPMQRGMQAMRSSGDGTNVQPQRDTRGRQRVTFNTNRPKDAQTATSQSKNSRRPPPKGGSRIPPPFKAMP
jgi:hypothetical protein